MTTPYNELVTMTEPHDQLGLIAAVILLIAALFVPQYIIYLVGVSIILIVGVLVDLTAHGWDH